MKLNHQIILLIALSVILILLFSFFVYESLSNKKIGEVIKEKKYTVEEVVEPEDIILNETAEIPKIEESEEEIEVLNEVLITIKDLKFYPDKIIISPGTTVIWFNNDTIPHKVVAYDRLFYGPRLNPGDKYSFTFTKEGTHKYFDAVFPKIGKGKIIVMQEPLPITAGVIGINLTEENNDGTFALLVLLFVIMILALSHGVYNHYKI